MTSATRTSCIAANKVQPSFCQPLLANILACVPYTAPRTTKSPLDCCSLSTSAADSSQRRPFTMLSLSTSIPSLIVPVVVLLLLLRLCSRQHVKQRLQHLRHAGPVAHTPRPAGLSQRDVTRGQRCMARPRCDSRMTTLWMICPWCSTKCHYQLPQSP